MKTRQSVSVQEFLVQTGKEMAKEMSHSRKAGGESGNGLLRVMRRSCVRAPPKPLKAHSSDRILRMVRAAEQGWMAATTYQAC